MRTRASNSDGRRQTTERRGRRAVFDLERDLAEAEEAVDGLRVRLGRLRSALVEKKREVMRPPPTPRGGGTYHQELLAFEGEMLRSRLIACGGNRRLLSRSLRLPLSTLHRRLRLVGLATWSPGADQLPVPKALSQLAKVRTGQAIAKAAAAVTDYRLDYEQATLAFAAALLELRLEQCDGDMSRAQQSLKLSESTFLRRRRSVGLAQSRVRRRRRRA